MASSTIISKLAEQIHRQLEGGDIPTESKWDRREIEIKVEQDASPFIKGQIIETTKEEGEWLINGGLWGVFPNIPVWRDAAREITYIVLPVKPIQLPMDKGVRIVADANENGDSYGEFIPVVNGWENFFQTRNVPPLQGRVGFKVEGNNAVFTENILKKRQIQGVTAKILTASADGTTLTISPDFEAAIIEKGFKWFADRNNPDMINDGNPEPQK